MIILGLGILFKPLSTTIFQNGYLAWNKVAVFVLIPKRRKLKLIDGTTDDPALRRLDEVEDKIALLARFVLRLNGFQGI